MRSLIRTLIVAACAVAAVAPSSVFAQNQGQGDVRVTKAPQLVQEVKAEYTDRAVEARVEGSVRLRLTISAVGKVDKVEVLEGLGYGLDEAAVAAAEQFVFEPAEINNQPAAVVLTFVVNFTLPILPAALQGRVIDKDTGRGVPAVVSLEYTGEEYDPKPSATIDTQLDGAFGFAEIPPGAYKLTLKVQGYDDYETEVVLAGGEVSEVSFGVAASAQNVVGQVREMGTRKALPGIKVEVYEPDAPEPFAETLTDGEGKFGFRGVPAGRYALRFSGDGYYRSASWLEVATGEVTDGTYQIEAEYYDEFRVRTTAQRARAEVSRRRLELEEVRRIPGTGGDVVRVVQNLPGVARAPGLSGLLIVRGSAPQDTKVYLDGDEIPAPYHFLGGPAVINSEMIDSLEFFPGNFSSYYGRSIGGVVDLSTRSPNSERIHGIAEVDLLDTTILVEGPVTEDFAVALSARRSYFDVFLPLILPKDGPDVFVAPRYYDGQLWLSYTGFDDHLLEAIFYLSDDRIAVLLPPDEPVGNQQVQIKGLDFVNAFYRGQFKWQWRPPLPIENDFFLSYGTNTISFDAGEELFFNLDYLTAAIRNDTRLKFSDHLTLRLGVDSQFGSVGVSFRSPTFRDEDFGSADGQGAPNLAADTITLDDRVPVMNPAVYIEPQIRPYDKLLLTPGVRVDHFGILGRTVVSPRFATRWTFKDRWTAKGGVGLFSQQSTGTTDSEFGNPNLTAEKALQYSLGAEWRPLDYLEFDVTGYYRDMYDLVVTTDEIVSVDGTPRPLYFDNDGEGRSFGAEVLLRHYPQNRFFGWVAYTLGWSQRLNQLTGAYDAYDYDQRHIFTFVGGYNLPFGIDISARFRLTTGNPYTPVVGSAYNADRDGYDQVFGAHNAARDPTFHQLDLRIDKKFVFQHWLLGLYLDVQNVYNRKNAEGMRYNFDYTDMEYVRGLPIIPTIGIKGEFWADGPIVKKRKP